MSKEYIERGALLEILENQGHADIDDVLNIPAADAVEVKHGRWEKHKTMHGFVYCSACKDVYLDAEWLADGKWGHCPNCGAKMDGGDDNGNKENL